jgi:hypothetical protein
MSLYVCSTFENNNFDSIPKRIVGCIVLIPMWAYIEASGYPNHQWYVHTNNVKNVQL